MAHSESQLHPPVSIHFYTCCVGRLSGHAMLQLSASIVSATQWHFGLAGIAKCYYKIVHMNLGKSSQQNDVRITANASCMIWFIYVSRFLVSNWLGQGRERLAWNWDWILVKTSGRSGVTNECTSFSCIPSTHVSMSDITQLCNILYNHFQTGRVV